MTLKLGVLESWFDGEPVVPGKTLPERLNALEEAGYGGIQLCAVSAGISVEDRNAALANSPVKLLIHGKHGQILGKDKETRDQAIRDIVSGLEEAAALEAVGSILVPIRTTPEIAAPAPVSFGVVPTKSIVDLEREILIDQLGKIAPTAERLGTPIILEPLNRYESHLLKSLDDAAQICRAVGSPGIRMMADFFHMNLEDADMGQAIEAVADVLAYVHLADSNRFQPSAGHLDFRPGFAALKRIGYDGWMTLECKLNVKPSVQALIDTAEFIRAEWEAA
ncbi:MAG: sugar phosphate isomerase/epimerase family protein [Thermomicrobiales bacterium]